MFENSVVIVVTFENVHEKGLLYKVPSLCKLHVIISFRYVVFDESDVCDLRKCPQHLLSRWFFCFRNFFKHNSAIVIFHCLPGRTS